jgi:hypothetical protein
VLFVLFFLFRQRRPIFLPFSTGDNYTFLVIVVAVVAIMILCLCFYNHIFIVLDLSSMTMDDGRDAKCVGPFSLRCCQRSRNGFFRNESYCSRSTSESESSVDSFDQQNNLLVLEVLQYDDGYDGNLPSCRTRGVSAVSVRQLDLSMQ